jgi:uncharacterized protein (TIGR02246 family)
MKTLLITSALILALVFGSQNANAQTDNKATFEAYLASVYAAYESGNADQMWAYYTDNAAEIGPDGSLASGKEAMKAGWDGFMQMVDKQPTFTYEMTSWRLIKPDVAIVTWNSTADIVLQGQQVGGPSSCSAVLVKVKGKWLIEMDTMTPIMEMPAGN